MTSAGVSIRRATVADVLGILDLQARNLPERGGLLSVGFPQAWFEAAIAAMPLIVAERGGQVLGYLVSAPFSALAQVPIVQAMLRAYPGSAGSYLLWSDLRGRSGPRARNRTCHVLGAAPALAGPRRHRVHPA